MSVGPEQRLSPEERANLTAYIDGELTENEERVIATKLSLSKTARGKWSRSGKPGRCSNTFRAPMLLPIFTSGP